MAIRKSPARKPPEPDCPLEECLTVFASAWTPKILWFLREGPRRFGDLKRDLVRISAKVLTARLKDLEKRGLVTRTIVPTSPKTVEYRLTKQAEAFQPVLDAMADVGRDIKGQR